MYARIRLGLLAFAFVLTGCTGLRIVDSDVRSFSTLETLPPASSLSYRFERLPSQQAQAAQSEALESMAQTALASVGLRRDDANPVYRVQLELRMARDPQAPWDDPRYIEGHARPYTVITRYGVLTRHSALSLQFEFPYFRRELGLVIRRASDGQVVYETRARHDGRWADDDAVLPAMFRAALDGFPAPGNRDRRVVIEIPR
jgi:hypothetical protein